MPSCRRVALLTQLALLLLCCFLSTAESDSSDDTSNVDKRSVLSNHPQYKRLLLLPYQRRQYRSSFAHNFVGKRSVDSAEDANVNDLLKELYDGNNDEFYDQEEEKRGRPSFSYRFVGKRLPEGYDLRAPSFGHRFVGKRDGSDYQQLGDVEEQPHSIHKRYAEDDTSDTFEVEVRAPSFGHRFVGKRQPSFGHRFVGKRQPSFGHRFVGKRELDMEDSEEETDMPELLGQEEAMEKRQPSFGHRFVGKRFPTFGHKFIGKRAPSFGHRFVGKRVPSFGHRFVGKRVPSFGHRFVGKRVPSFGHRFVGKRVPSFGHRFVGKRVPSFGHRFVGKRAPSFGHRFVGKRIPDGLDTRVPSFGHRFVGKREQHDTLPDVLNVASLDSSASALGESDMPCKDPFCGPDKRQPSFGHRFVGKRAESQSQEDSGSSNQGEVASTSVV